jgi:hypothetical protein
VSRIGAIAAGPVAAGTPSALQPDAALNAQSAAAQPALAASSAPSARQPVNIPSALGARPNAFGAIQGNALRATGASLPEAVVRLRDARFGRIVDTQTSDQSGVFAFGTVDPGVYVVEVVGDDQGVLAASQLLNVNAGDMVSTSVRLPFRRLPLGGVLGNSTPAAAIIAAEAAAAGVLIATSTEPVSPTQ